MKKRWIVLFIIISMLGITGCNSDKIENTNNNLNKVENATLNENGDIIIDEEDVTEVATFLNYEVDGVTIGLIVVRGTDGKVRVAFNTCQSCTPSPSAYFIQKGEYLECQNCGSKFHIDQIGIEKGGCNPAPVEDMTKENGIITISAESVKTYQKNFKNWNGPKI